VLADVINKAGHRIGTAEIESALVSHRACAEAAVVAIPDEVKGFVFFAFSYLNRQLIGKPRFRREAIVAFCSLKQGFDENEDTVSELKREVRKSIGAIAVPDYVVITQTLPKTRSGKIMRRVLRKVAQHQTDPASLGDVSTLADPQDLVHLIARAESSIPKPHH
jgi:acetyl-CoA synthetase